MNDKANDVNILKNMVWDDPTIYLWRLKDKSPKWTSFITYSIGSAFFGPTIIYLILWVTSFLYNQLSAWLGLIGLILMIYLFIVSVIKSFSKKSHYRINARHNRYISALAALGTTVYLIIAQAKYLGMEFVGSTSSIFQWVFFFVENLAEVITLDFIQIFNFSISEIYADNFVAKFFTSLFKLYITFGVIELFLAAYRISLKEHIFYGTVKDCYFECEEVIFFNGKGCKLWNNGKMTSGELISLDIEKFMKKFKSSANKDDMFS